MYSNFHNKLYILWTQNASILLFGQFLSENEKYLINKEVNINFFKMNRILEIREIEHYVHNTSLLHSTILLSTFTWQ